ncbi:MAG: putative minor capsid protein 10B [Prokaryotic dsDNA virus sp.]|nr:MAG: putative minor capsid protein 10B [Prokaryotic dsDNA virus sp.]|tara:strand:+ start:10319 stop:11461 length:1143 start_codon:yes stop_codon:yes gene_type:complete
MANTLTDLAADIYKAADIVGRELVGFIPASTVNAGSEQAAVGQTVRSFTTPAASAVTISPSMTIPEGTDQTLGNKTLTITEQRGVQIPYTGEDVRFLDGGAGYETVYGAQIQQAMRTLVNEMEADLAGEAYKNASRAVGTAGTTPFGSNFNAVAEARQILADNGMPVNDGRTSLVVNTAAGTNLRNLASLQQVNTAGGDDLLRRGELLNLQGVSLKESGQVISHTKGTGTSYLLNDASSAVGDTTIAADGGSGTILAGDIITLAGDTNNYVVNTALSGGSLVIGDIGLRAAAADNAAITVGNNYTANVMMHQAGLELAMRAPAKPVGGDAAEDTLVVQDPTSGLVFEVAVYKGFNKAMIQVGAVWGYKAWNSDAIAIVMG